MKRSRFWRPALSQSKCHARLEGFAQCALDEERYFNTIPKNEFEERQMLEREGLEHYETLVIEAQTEIEEEIHPRLTRLRYELEITQRLRDRAEDEQSRDDWRIQVDVQEMVVGQQEGRLAEVQTDIARYETIVAEIEADLAQESQRDQERL